MVQNIRKNNQIKFARRSLSQVFYIRNSKCDAFGIPVVKTSDIWRYIYGKDFGVRELPDQPLGRITFPTPKLQDAIWLWRPLGDQIDPFVEVKKDRTP